MSELTPTMRACLDAITAEQGQPAKSLPGGIQTVWALMRRGLVETDRDEAWHVFLPAHRHSFVANFHMDGCHWFKSSGTCECGVIHGFYGERSVKADPYSMVWYDEDDECERCKALMAGARPIYEVVIQRPAHYTPPLEVVA